MSRERKPFRSDKPSSGGDKKKYSGAKDSRPKTGKSGETSKRVTRDASPGDKRERGDDRPAMFVKRKEKSDKPYESRAQKEYGDSKELRPSKFKSLNESGESQETPKRVTRDFKKTDDKGAPKRVSRDSSSDRKSKSDKPKTYVSRTGRSTDSEKSKEKSKFPSPFKKRAGESDKEQSQQRIQTDSDGAEKKYDPKHNAKFKDKKPFGPKKSKGDPLPSFSTDIRLNKYISNAGICSRREADVMITSGIVQVNGKIILELGYKVKPDDVVKYDGATIRSEKKQYVLLNKPKDFITTMDDPQNRKTVMQLVVKACRERIYPVGRLDRNTTGLLLFTNDGDLAKKLTHPRYEIKKLYHVETVDAVTKEQIAALLSGVELDDGGFVKADKVELIKDAKNREVGVEIHSGKYRVVRRMFESLNHVVKKLDRVSFAGLTKKDLPRGTYRHLTEQEVNFLRML